MNARGKLSSVERQFRKALAGVELTETEVRQRQRAANVWIEWRAGMRRKPPAVLDITELPPPPIPSPPAGLSEDVWRDALEAVACFSARIGRRIGPDDYLDGMNARGRELAERHAARLRLILLAPADEVPWFFSSAAPVFIHDPEADAILSAVGVYFSGFPEGEWAGRFMEIVNRAGERSRSV